MKAIIYTRPDGGLSVVHPVVNSHPTRENITEEEALERALAKIPSDAINPHVVEASAIPTDRTFRNAWEDNGGVKVNMNRARELHKAKLREIRAPKLLALDVEYMRADESGDAAKKAGISAKKQALRDVTADPEIEAAQTPEELKVVLPECLK